MLIEEIKKANMEALKARDNNARSVYSIVLSKVTALQTDGSGREIGDPEVLNVIKKVYKELEEEQASYKAAGREESVAQLELQKKAIERFIPAQLGEGEIRKIIDGLPDKSMPAIMKHFKMEYAGKVDMGLVNRIARTL